MNDPTTFTHRPDAAAWRRAIARVLDLLTVFMILWGLSVLHVLWFMGDLADSTATGPWGRALAPTLAFVILATIYDAVFTVYNHGQTPGKDVMCVRVVKAAGDVPVAAVLLRAAAVNVVWLVPPLVLAFSLFCALSLVVGLDPRTGLHDAVLRTRVVPYDRSAEDPEAPPKPGFLRRRRHDPDETSGTPAARGGNERTDAEAKA